MADETAKEQTQGTAGELAAAGQPVSPAEAPAKSPATLARDRIAALRDAPVTMHDLLDLIDGLYAAWEAAGGR